MLDWQHPRDWSVLVVDDEPDNLDLIVLYFNYLGATVRSALNGPSGLRCLQGFQPDLIMLDLSMPQMDGWELLQILRSMPSLRHVPIVALTAHAMPADKIKVKEAGFDGYITKPLNLPNFMANLRQTLTTFNSPKEILNARL
ncbi:MAG: response regulator [Anaerolineae bacterium]|nr:response regulator [Anaerolineae bacterium]